MTSSSPSSSYSTASSTTRKMHTTSHIAVDLSDRHICKALTSLQSMTKRMNKIRSAHVFCSRPHVGIHSKLVSSPTNNAAIYQIFAILSQMSNLRTVQIQLLDPQSYYTGTPLVAIPSTTTTTKKKKTKKQSHNGGCNPCSGSLPLATITCLLRGARRLKTLHLSKMDLTLTTSGDFEDFGQALKDHKHLHTIEIVSCGSGGGAGGSTCTATATSTATATATSTSNACMAIPTPSATVSGSTGRMSQVLACILKHGNPKHFKCLTVDGTPLGYQANTIITRLCNTIQESNSLSCLKLLDIPDLQDHHIIHLCMALTTTNSNSNSNTNNIDNDEYNSLEELHIRSSILTEYAGDAITTMLLLNTSLKHLVLHLDCESLGYNMARCLYHNATLETVDLRCYGDDEAVYDAVIEMARALRIRPCNSVRGCRKKQQQLVDVSNNSNYHHDNIVTTTRQSNVTSLRLSLEIEPFQFQQDIIAAFAAALKHNDVLSQLVIDDGIESYPLTEEMELQLKLNRCGYSQYNNNRDHTIHYDASQYVQSMTEEINDINVLYTIMNQHPEILCQAAAAVTTKAPALADAGSSSYSTIDSSSVDGNSNDEQDEQPPTKTKKKKSYSLPRRTKSGSSTSSSKSLGRRVLSILAPSA